jgi:TonB family protein
VAQAACCLYWFHPLAWLAARQMRREREQACDDAVLGRGIAAQDYAGHLVDSARAMRGQRTGALAMAEPSELERRVRALLDGGRDRRPLNRAAAGVMVTALASVLLPAAAIAVHAQAAPVPERAYAVHAPPQLTQHDAQAQPVPESSRSIPVAAEVSRPQAATTISMGDALRETYRQQVAQTAALAAARPDQQTAPAAGGLGGISGVVQDPSGARIPNCWITVKDADGSNEQSTFTNTAGAYQFPSLPAGRYTLQVSSPGFKKATLTALSVQPSQTMTANLRLQIGAVTESVTVKAARPAVVAAPAVEAATAGERLRVGGMVQPAMIIRKVAPVYPEDLRAQGITGTVHLAAIIGKQGNLTEIHPLSGPNPGLIAAAMEAASHWVYQPTLLNGEPVMVETTIDITFELQ